MIRTVSAADIAALKERAAASPRKRERISLHDSHADRVQEMVICLLRESYIRPHKHPASESYHVIEGELEVHIFSEAGVWQKMYVLSARQPIYRLPAGIYHQPVALTDCAIYHEVYPGPWAKDTDVLYAPWAQKEAA